MTNDILLPHPSRLEAGIESLQGRVDDAAPLIRNQWIPEKTAPVLLPWLAWGLSVDAWDDSWTDEERAAAVRSSIAFHRLKGTLAGIQEAIRLGGGRFLRIIRPPSTFFAAPSMTADERDAFLARYPELRIYKFRPLGFRGFAMFMASDFLSDPTAQSGRRTRYFPSVSDAVFRYGERVTIVDHGVETSLKSVTRYREAEEGISVDYTEIRQGTKAVGLFPGAFVSMFTVDHGASGRIYLVRAKQTYSVSEDRLHLNSVKPSLEPVNYDAVPVAQRGVRHGFMLDCSYVGAGVAKGTFLPRSTARDRLYDRLYLFDKTRALEGRGRSSHLGAVRFSMPHHEAEVTVQIRGKRNPRALGRYVAGFAIASDGAKLQNIMRLINSARPASVKISLNTKTVDVVRAGVATKAGTIKAGELVEII